MREFFREIVHALEEGRPVELVSIAASDGSTPRGAGAMMAVFPGGGITGTIGGGNVEFECQRLAAELLERGGDALRQFRFTLGDAASLGMVCGGGVTVEFQYLPAGEPFSYTHHPAHETGRNLISRPSPPTPKLSSTPCTHAGIASP